MLLVKSLLTLTIPLPLFAQSEVVVDRGIPKINLNNASGPVRSNVRWAWHDQGFLGDDFKIGAPGERWVIDYIRTWTVPGTQAHRPDHLGDAYQYFGSAVKDLTPVIADSFAEGRDTNDNPNIQVTEATQNGEIAYDDFGTSLRVWQLEFRGLNLPIMAAKPTGSACGDWAATFLVKRARNSCGISSPPMPLSAEESKMPRMAEC
jgi:hypothetical protein